MRSDSPVIRSMHECMAWRKTTRLHTKELAAVTMNPRMALL